MQSSSSYRSAYNSATGCRVGGVVDGCRRSAAFGRRTRTGQSNSRSAGVSSYDTDARVVVTGTVLFRHRYTRTGTDALLVTWHSCTVSGNQNNVVCGPPKTSATSADILISNTNVEPQFDRL